MTGRKWVRTLCLPSVLILAVLTLYPLGRTFYLSLTNASLTNLDHPDWIGFDNYISLIRDPAWWRATRNTLIFATMAVTLETLIGLGIALILDAPIKARSWVRTAVLVPWAIPSVVSARIWSWMFNDFYGVINSLIRWFRLGGGQIAWLADPRLSLLTLVLVDVWKTTSFMAILLLAGKQTISRNIHEAAQVDGASRWQEFIYVTLPLLKPALGIAVLFRVLDALRVFDLPYVLTSNSRATAVLSTYALQQMVDFQEVGYGAAASFLIFFGIALIAVLYLLFSRKQLGLNQ